VLHEEEVENENVPQRDHGLTLEDFIVFEKLGEGTYSEVFRALESKTGFLCALKILNKQRLREENLL
jgi:serine/threonine protein kinase